MKEATFPCFNNRVSFFRQRIHFTFPFFARSDDLRRRLGEIDFSLHIAIMFTSPHSTLAASLWAFKVHVRHKNMAHYTYSVGGELNATKSRVLCGKFSPFFSCKRKKPRNESWLLWKMKFSGFPLSAREGSSSPPHRSTCFVVLLFRDGIKFEAPAAHIAERTTHNFSMLVRDD